VFAFHIGRCLENYEVVETAMMNDVDNDDDDDEDDDHDVKVVDDWRCERRLCRETIKFLFISRMNFFFLFSREGT